MIEDLLNNKYFMQIIYSVLAILICFVVYRMVTTSVIKRLDAKLSDKKAKTYIRLFKSVSKYIFIIIGSLIVLKIWNVNIASIVAGVGIVGVVVGFAIQDLLKDIIKGFNIISDNYYSVGDIIKYKENMGKVLEIGLITTKIEDLITGNIVSISNRNILEVEIVSKLINIDVPLPYELKKEKADKVLDKIVKEIEKYEKVEKCEYLGISELADSSLKYRIKIYTEPIDKIQVRRDALGCIILCLEKENISVPFNQIDIHQK